MAISKASKRKLAIWAVALALGGGTLTASAEACGRSGEYGYSDSAYPAAAGYGFRGYGWRDEGWGWRDRGWGWRGAGLGWRAGGVGWRRGGGWRDGDRRGEIAAEINIEVADRFLFATFFNMRAAVDRCLPILVN